MSGNEVGRNFKKINILLERGRNHDLKLWGLTGTQMEIMEYLHDRNGEECVLSNIAAFFDVKHTSVLHVVKILEKKGLIGREEKQGGRLRRIYLTAAGKALMQDRQKKVPGGPDYAGRDDRSGMYNAAAAAGENLSEPESWRNGM